MEWNKLCRPLSEGGLGLRSFASLNETTNFKLCWEMVTTENDWASLWKSRVIRKDKCITYHIFSSIWSSIKGEFNVLSDNISLLVGDDQSINFWTDCWCGPQLFQTLHINHHVAPILTAKVNDFIVNGHWEVPHDVQLIFPNLLNIVQQVSLPLISTSDSLFWKHSTSGELSLDAFLFKFLHGQLHNLAESIWSPYIPRQSPF